MAEFKFLDGTVCISIYANTHRKGMNPYLLDVVANVLDYYIHFWTNTLGKGMNSLFPPAVS